MWLRGEVKIRVANASRLFAITSRLNHICNFYKARRKGFVQILIWSLIAPMISFVAVTATAPVAKAVSANPSPVCSGEICKVTFPYTGDYYTWTVPAGVTSIDFDVQAAAGGTSTEMYSPASGGLGGRVTGNLTVSPSSALFIYVGGQPSAGSSSGGWNGGGASLI